MEISKKFLRDLLDRYVSGNLTLDEVVDRINLETESVDDLSGNRIEGCLNDVKI